jgi:hypothetical protein
MRTITRPNTGTIRVCRRRNIQIRRGKSVGALYQKLIRFEAIHGPKTRQEPVETNLRLMTLE